jgi:hypothetical protein
LCSSGTTEQLAEKVSVATNAFAAAKAGRSFRSLFGMTENHALLQSAPQERFFRKPPSRGKTDGSRCEKRAFLRENGPKSRSVVAFLVTGANLQTPGCERVTPQMLSIFP